MTEDPVRYEMDDRRLTRRGMLVGTGGVCIAGCLVNEDDDDVAPSPGSGLDDGDTIKETHPTDASDENPNSDTETEEWCVCGSPLDASVDVSIAVENLEHPWEIAFAPGGDVFITERPGRIRRGTIAQLTSPGPTDASEFAVEPVTLPGLSSSGEGGILGVALHPAYPDPPFVYVFYTASEDSRVDRVIRYDATTGGDVARIVDGLPGARNHNGGRIAFGPDDQLWITRGDVSDPDAAQDPSSLIGAVLRVTADGDPAGSDDAPSGADPRVVTFGHRNMQGIDWLPDGTPIATEHGPTGRDEVHLLTPGHNYGWPVARGGPDDPDYESYAEHPAFSPPIADSGRDGTWAPSGATWYDDVAIPELQHRFLFGGLRSQRVHVVSLLKPGHRPPEDAIDVYEAEWYDDRYLAIRHELFVEEFGRIRHVAAGPEGELYLLTSNGDDVIVQLTPS